MTNNYLSDFSADVYVKIIDAKKTIIPIKAGEIEYVAYEGADDAFLKLMLEQEHKYIFIEEILLSEIDDSISEDDERSDDIVMLGLLFDLGSVMLGKRFHSKQYSELYKAAQRQSGRCGEINVSC